MHGHRHPRIDAAVRDQLDRVAHSTMLGLSHRAGDRAGARGWSRSRRPGSTRVFYSDTARPPPRSRSRWPSSTGGSAARTRRTKFVSLREAYHGDTIGSVSVGGIDLFHSLYRPLLFDTLHAEPGDAADMERVLSSTRARWRR